MLSQTTEHAAFGGVVPEIAARAHVEMLDYIIAKAMAEAGKKFTEIDGVAAAAGPGLIGGVIVGLTTAKAIALVNEKPLLAVNHLEAHALTARLTDGTPFPYCLFLASGGHTQILAVLGVGNFVQARHRPSTTPSAKPSTRPRSSSASAIPAARWSSGKPPAAIRNASRCRGRWPASRMPISRSPGSKTALRLEAEKIAPISDEDVRDLCASFQQAIADVVADRLRTGMKLFRERYGTPTALVAAGGVAANQTIRKTLHRIAFEVGTVLVVPPPELCTDNGAMIAWAGAERLALGLTDTLDTPPHARWPLSETGRTQAGRRSRRAAKAGRGPHRLMTYQHIGVVGGGAWGTALAIAAARAGRQVTLWEHDAANAEQLATKRESLFLPGVRIDDAHRRDPRLRPPSRGRRRCCWWCRRRRCARSSTALAPVVAAGTPLVVCAKGIEAGTHAVHVRHRRRMRAQGGAGDPVGTELRRRRRARPADRGDARGRATKRPRPRWRSALGSATFRPYHSTDVRGAEIGGAAKNVLAIGAGIVAGRQLGASATAALITRGFAELTRFGRAFGARPETLTGLSGLGDLVLTCSTPQSRNFSFGHALGKGQTPDQVRAGAKLSEGAFTAPVLVEMARAKGVEMPISAAVAAILDGTMSVGDAIEGLLTRPFRAEG